MIKLYRLDDPVTDTWLFANDREYVARHEHTETKVEEGFFVTADELTQIKKEAFEAGAVRAQWEIIIGNYTYEVSEIKPPDLYEYLKRHFEEPEGSIYNDLTDGGNI